MGNVEGNEGCRVELKLGVQITLFLGLCLNLQNVSHILFY